MKITIITVSFNCEKTIEQTINSVLLQTYKDIEYIIIDGNSSDNTVNIIKKYEKNISYWISEPDSGIYNAMNKGIKKATGEYIQFLNSDDALVSEETIELVCNALKKYGYPDILSAAIWMVDEKNCIQKIGGNNINLDDIKNGINIPHPGMFMKREILNEYGFNENYKIVSDFDLVLRCAFANKSFCFIKEPVVFFSDVGISSNNEILLNKEYNIILSKYIKNKKVIKKENKIKSFLKSTNLIKYIRLYFRGWKKHQCNNKYCRWCKNKK